MSEVKDPNEVIHIGHPDIEGTGTSTREALDEVWAEKGWVEAAAPEPDPELVAYDPSAHSVAEVKDYLADFAPNDPERERVAAVEAAGKDRKIT